MKKLMVLVVDDDLVSRLLPSFILKTYDSQVQVYECESGEDALRMLASHQVTHVLLDISMPSLNGIQVAQVIRERFNSAEVQVIAYTADVGMTDELYLKSLGFDSLLLKPPSRADLLKALSL